MWPPIILPFLRDSISLPSPLPTKSDIENSTVILRHDPNYHKVVVVGQYFLVKYGRGVEQREGDTLYFIEHNLRVSAPRLYAMYREESNGWLYIIMELLPGQPLDKIWPALLPHEKTLIINKLRHIFDQMRLLPSPGFYGDVSRRSIPHHLFWTRKNIPSISGPFVNEHEFNMSFVGKLRMIAQDNGAPSYKADFYEKTLSLALRNNPPTFSHSDVQRKNILVREIAPAFPDQEKDYEVAIIDWEDAGWYPSYWEYASVAIAFQWDDDWPEKYGEFIRPWPAEMAMVKMLYQDIFF
jgi:hypothetical protein